MPDTKTAVFPSKEDRRRAVEAWKEQIGNKLLAPTVEALKNAPTSKGGRIPRLRNVFVKVGRVDPFSVAKALGVEVVTGQQDDK